MAPGGILQHLFLETLSSKVTEGPIISTQTLVGIVVSISGNVLISFALNLQKLAHKRTAHKKRLEANGAAPKQNVNPKVTVHEHPHENDGGSSSPEARGSTGVDGQPPRSAASETQALVVSPTVQVRDYGAASPLPGRLAPPSPSDQSKQRKTLARLFPFKKRAPRETSLPVEIVTEDEALRALPTNIRKQRQEEDTEVEDNEGEYLKSKIWSVLIQHFSSSF